MTSVEALEWLHLIAMTTEATERRIKINNYRWYCLLNYTEQIAVVEDIRFFNIPRPSRFFIICENLMLPVIYADKIRCLNAMASGTAQLQSPRVYFREIIAKIC